MFLQLLANFKRNGKATGLNTIPNKILKCSKNVISQSLADIFNASIQSGIFPDDFKIARVTPIFKEGEKGDVSNYRPISILCIVARVSEKLLYNQPHQYLVQHNILYSDQWGFRSLHSTVLALIDCTDNWKLNIDKEKINSTILLNIKKDFDTIDHDILLQKLSHYGVANLELNFFRSYFHERKQCCNVNGQSSTFEKVRCGVPQGSILGFLLLIIYMNDLPLCIKNGHVTMYADDRHELVKLHKICKSKQ